MGTWTRILQRAVDAGRDPLTGRTRVAGTGMHLPALLAGAFVAALLTLVLARTLTIAPTFDGAMNLQVAWSLAEGDGYARSYADRDPFPHEVQTGGPYILVAAFGYRLWGMGIAQSQFANVFFLMLLSAAAMALGRSMRGRLTDGMLAMALLLATPGLLQYGNRGYGEVPALALALSGLALYPWSGRHSHARATGGAVLLAMAVVTKTVLLACVAPFGLAMALHAATRPSHPAERAKAVALLALAFLATLAAWEAFRLASLGDLTEYRAWWAFEATAIAGQAGLQDARAMGAVVGKASEHFALLGRHVRLPQLVVLAWIALPFALLALLPRSAVVSRWIIAAVLGAVAVYFTWWLGFTPTEKAWHRRIFNGMLLVNLGWGLLAGAWAAANGSRRHRLIQVVITVAAWLLVAVNLWQTRLHDALRPVDNDAIHTAARVIRDLPADALLFAGGWSSSPAISLLAGRPLLDINDVPFDHLVAGPETYLVVDNEGGYAAPLQRILDTYAATPLLPGDVLPQVYRFDARTLAAQPALSDLTRQRRLDELDDTQVVGFHGGGADGRWATADAAVRAVYGGQDVLALEAYILPEVRYQEGRVPAITVLLNGCRLPPMQSRPGVHTLQVPLAPCAPALGDAMTIRIQSDALVENAITVDDRAMAFIAKSLELRSVTP